jgi:hypothetical protein
VVHVHLTNVIVVDDGGQWPSNLTSEETVPFSLLCLCVQWSYNGCDNSLPFSLKYPSIPIYPTHFSVGHGGKNDLKLTESSPGSPVCKLKHVKVPVFLLLCTLLFWPVL